MRDDMPDEGTIKAGRERMVEDMEAVRKIAHDFITKSIERMERNMRECMIDPDCIEEGGPLHAYTINEMGCMIETAKALLPVVMEMVPSLGNVHVAEAIVVIVTTMARRPDVMHRAIKELTLRTTMLLMDNAFSTIDDMIEEEGPINDKGEEIVAEFEEKGDAFQS